MRVINILILVLLPNLAFSTELQTLASRLNSSMHDQSQLGNALERGKNRTTLCQYCHGSNGISSRPYIPNLAGQHPVYLLKQMLHFANGTRKSEVMSPLAKKLTEDDMINVAIYYATMPVPSALNDVQHYDTRLLTAGMDIYNTRCAQCHGTSGKGTALFPRLAGQKVDFIVNTLTMFAAPDAEKNNPLQFNAVRSNPEMVNIVKALKPTDIRAVANYIATLR